MTACWESCPTRRLRRPWGDGGGRPAMTEGDTMRGAWRRRMPAGLAVLLLGGAGTAAGSTAAAAGSTAAVAGSTAAVAGSTAAVAGTTAGGALPTGQVYLVHGILGTPVDVDVDGR